MKIIINKEACAACGRCVRVCPSAVFRITDGEERCHPEVINAQGCIGCGHCVDVCSTNALSHELFPASKIHKVRRDIIPSPESLMELLRSRRSNRTITDQEIPVQAITDMVEAAYYAPTAENSRRVHVTVLTDRAQLQAVEDATMHFFLRLARVLLFPLIRPITRLCLADLYNEAPELKRFEKRWQQGEHPCTCNAKALIAFSAPKGYDFGWQDCNLVVCKV